MTCDVASIWFETEDISSRVYDPLYVYVGSYDTLDIDETFFWGFQEATKNLKKKAWHKCQID